MTELWVKPITGELLRFMVESESEPSKPHLVDLESFRFNGECDCGDFTFHPRANPKRKQLESGADPSRDLKCKHIKAARDYYLDSVVLPAVAAKQYA